MNSPLSLKWGEVVGVAGVISSRLRPKVTEVLSRVASLPSVSVSSAVYSAGERGDHSRGEESDASGTEQTPYSVVVCRA